MRASHRWLVELSGVDVGAPEMAEKLTRAGLEVESVTAAARGLDGVVVAEVRAKSPHPKRDKLTLVEVWDGSETHAVLCGAPNVPEPGGRVLLARVGATLPGGLAIGERAIAGVTSRGMLCSEAELGIGADGDGIVVLGRDVTAAPGTPAVDALALADHVLEIGLTPNRPDGLGHVGLAREVALVFGAKRPTFETVRGAKLDVRAVREGAGTIDALDGAPAATIEILDASRCPRYGAALVHGVKVGPSPFWARYRLHLLGVRALRNVVDATNLALLEWGYPTHAFDHAALRGGRIVVRRARDGEPMKTLDGVTRALSGDDLLICDGDGPVAIAGVMGGADSEITDATRTVLVETAYFDPRSVRRTSRRVGLHTEASHRFERGVDRGAVPVVLARTAELVAQLAGGAIGRVAVDVQPVLEAPRTVALRRARLAAVLGTSVPDAETERVLDGVGCALTATAEGWVAEVPTFRPDLGREIDLVEEVARVRGYDAIPTELPRVRASTEGSPPLVGFVRRLRELAAAAGLFEARNFAFLAPRDLEAARVSTAAVRVANPLSEDRSVLRTAILPGLLADAVRARRHQVDAVSLFELARVFHPSAEGPLPRERHELALLLAGPRGAWIGEGEQVDFHDAKGRVDALLTPLLGAPPELVVDDALEAEAPFLHPRRRARIVWQGASVGVLGEVHPDVVRAHDLAGRAVCAVLAVEALLEASARRVSGGVRPLAKFPASSRDLAVIVAADVRAGDVAAALSEAGGALAEAVTLFDLYTGEPIPAGHKSLAFRVVYRDPDATLTDERVDAAHARVKAAAEARFGASLRS